MTIPLDLYKDFIDVLAADAVRRSVVAQWVREWGAEGPQSTQTTPQFDELMSHFNPEQRQIMAYLLQQEHDSGMFNVLAYLSDQMSLRGLRLTRDGVELPVEPFGMTLYEDWIRRIAGDRWPDDQSGE
jgi:hypothetical protein